MSYQEAVARGIVSDANRRIISHKGNVSTTAQTTFNTWTDQDGNAYTAVPSGKTFYISDISVTLADVTGANTNSCSVAIGNATVQPYLAEIVSSGAINPDIDGLLQLASGDVPTAIFGIALSASEAAVTLMGWEK